MKVYFTKYKGDEPKGGSTVFDKTYKGVVELVDGDKLLNRIYVSYYGDTNYEGDDWSAKYYDEFIKEPSGRYEKKNISPMSLKADKKDIWFTSGDLTTEQFEDPKAKSTLLATIDSFVEKIKETNAGIIADYYLDKMKDAKLDYEKRKQELYSAMTKTMGDNLMKYSKLSYDKLKEFSKPKSKCVYGRQFSELNPNNYVSGKFPLKQGKIVQNFYLFNSDYDFSQLDYEDKNVNIPNQIEKYLESQNCKNINVTLSEENASEMVFKAVFYC